jgi:hypothetical protein
LKKKSQKRAGGLAQGVALSSNPSTTKLPPKKQKQKLPLMIVSELNETNKKSLD